MRCTVPRQHAYALEVRHDCIDTFQTFLSFIIRQCQERLVNTDRLRLMHLMRHDEPLVADAQLLTQQGAVLMDSLSVVATIAVDIKLAIASCAETSLSRRAERHNILVQVKVE